MRKSFWPALVLVILLAQNSFSASSVGLKLRSRTSLNYGSAYDLSQYTGIFGTRSNLWGFDVDALVGVGNETFFAGAALDLRLNFDGFPDGGLASKAGFQWFLITPTVAVDFSKYRLMGQYQFLGIYYGASDTYENPQGFRIEFQQKEVWKYQNKPLQVGFFVDVVSYDQKKSGSAAATMSTLRYVTTGISCGFDFL